MVLERADPLKSTAPHWVWWLLLAWLVYTFAALGWYVLNDPALMGSICRTR
jgi:hypothetical protein